MRGKNSEFRSDRLIEGLEGRRFLCGTSVGTAPTGVADTAAIVVRPLFTPVLGTYAGDLATGSNVEGFSATAQFKLVLKSYDASTGVLKGTYYISDVVVDGTSQSSTIAPFDADAHFTSAGGFDIHVAGVKGNAKLKGDYKRQDTFISGTLIGTVVTSKGKTDNFSFAFDLSKRS